jgi:hypothetical protein
MRGLTVGRWGTRDGRLHTIEWQSDVVIEQGLRVGRNFHNGEDSYRYRELPRGGVELVIRYRTFGIEDVRTMRDRRQAGKYASTLWLREYNKRIEA